jgi:hypothetical protein
MCILTAIGHNQLEPHIHRKIHRTRQKRNEASSWSWQHVTMHPRPRTAANVNRGRGEMGTTSELGCPYINPSRPGEKKKQNKEEKR